MDDKPRRWWHVSLGDLIQVGMLGATFYIAWLTNDGMRLTRDGMAITSRNIDETAAATRSAQRAYFVTVSMQLTEPLKAGKKPQILGVMKNTGLTPALNIRSGRVVVIDSQEPVFEGESFKLAEHSVLNLGAGQDVGFNADDTLFFLVDRAKMTRTDLTALTAQHVADLNAGRLQLYVRSFSRYRDVFMSPKDPDNETDECTFWRKGAFTICNRGSTMR